MTIALDEQRVEEFAGRVFGLYSDGMLTFMVDIGYRTGLFEAAADGSSLTSGELAARAGLSERYVREWLGALTSAGIFTYSDGTYSLPAEHAACLTGAGAENLAVLAQLTTHLGKHVHEVADAFRTGGGVPYSAFRPEFTGVMDSLSRGIYDQHLVSSYVPLVPGLRERLVAGCRLADVGCGSGHALVVLAREFPASVFVGYDISAEAIAVAREEALGLPNVRFEVCDAAALAVDTPFDLIMTFDAIHDQADPAGALRAIHSALAPDGTYLMAEPAASSNLEDNIGNPMAGFLYSVSTLHCLTVSLAEGGAGLGTAWGEQLARTMLSDAGFGQAVRHDAPGDPSNAVFVVSRESKANGG
ncbi:methyltransferase domain-containing protein [Lentzea tibetensis]|uniref:Methyltransferase domain-containing protein n=1 Tax=Lentzea tibetensis TaxID=2591470 RepID=A0A563EYR1_9PSEU|nr:class I SAM-dependent methyltransferase [Lentzea tibetensis]TWP52865.1 methyltransferase domain-containing protein [Lentzea tibetensis]